MEFCSRQQLFDLPPPSWARAVWPAGSQHPAAAGRLLCRSPRPPSVKLQITTASATTNAGYSSEVTCLENIIRDTKLPRAGKFFELEMTVRDCDLDVSGVVNNSVYSAYIETARQEMVASLGVCTGSIARSGRAMALSELEVKYFAPLERGAKLSFRRHGEGCPNQGRADRMLMEHLIATLPDRKLVLEAMATVVCLNQDYRPTRMFPEMAKLLHFFSHPNN